MVQMSDSGQLLGISDALSEPSDTTTQVERLGPVGQQLQKAMDNADEAFEKAAEVKRSADDAAAKALKAQEAAITARAAAKAAAEAGGVDPQKVAEMVSKVLVGDNAFLNKVTAHKVVLDPRNIVSDPLFTDAKAWYQATGGNTSEQYGLTFAKYNEKTDPSITGGPSYLRMRRHRGSSFNIMVANDCAPGGLAVGAGSQWVARIRYRWPADTVHSKSVRWCITYQRPAPPTPPDGGGDGVALVGGIVSEHDAVLGVDDDGLDRRGARVDAEPAAALGLVEAGLGDHVEAVAGHELPAGLGGGGGEVI